jgi:membrane-bound lytic murein transglycosylase B
LSARIHGPLVIVGGLTVCVVVVAASATLLVLVFVHQVVGLVYDLPAPAASISYAPSPEAESDIPALYLHLYQAAAARFGLDWTVLAGIGKVECDHGRDPAPSCTVVGALNEAGAGGPAQFLVSTWQRYGITPDGQGTPDMWNPADAIYSMANYLHASGAPGNYRRAIFAYNHAWWYVDEVLGWAARYRAHYGAGQPASLP